MSFAFPRDARLLSPKEFSFVFDDAKPGKSPHFTILTRVSQHDHARLGLVVSRKISRKAVARNRLKRIVRESFRQNKHHLPNIDIVVLPRVLACTTDNEVLFRSLDKHWQRINNANAKNR